MPHIDPHMRCKRAARADRIAELATRQHGVIARRQLLELGVARTTIDRWLRGKRLHPVHRGAYSVGHRSLTHRGRLMAAVLACDDGAVLSHLSAAWLWNLGPDSRTVIDVTARRRRRTRRGIAVHEAALDPADRTEIDALPLTSLARTLLDVATQVNARRLARMVEEAERLRLFDLAAIDDVIERNHGHHGIGRLRGVVAAHTEPPLTRSELERRFASLVREAGLPLPSFNVNLLGYEVDVLWERQRVVVELDGYDFHRTRRAFEEDRERDARLSAAGYVILRFTWRQVLESAGRVLAAVRRTLTQS